MKKYPVLDRHKPTQALGKARSVNSANGTVSATVDLNRRGKRFVLKMQRGNARYHQPTWWQREQARNERLAFWGSVILLVASVMLVAFIAGQRHGTKTAKTLVEYGRHGY